MAKFGMKFDAVVSPDSRFLDVHFQDDEEFKVAASSETGNEWKESRTWNFEHGEFKYRVQVQVTPQLL
jgi:hypothetical protein